MAEERRPVRQLGLVDRIRIRFGKCPTCRKRLTRIPHDDVAHWQLQPQGVMKVTGSFGATGHGRMQRGTITDLKHQKVPHCPRCHHVFMRGWIYPSTPSSEATTS